MSKETKARIQSPNAHLIAEEIHRLRALNEADDLLIKLMNDLFEEMAEAAASTISSHSESA